LPASSCRRGVSALPPHLPPLLTTTRFSAKFTNRRFPILHQPVVNQQPVNGSDATEFI